MKNAKRLREKQPIRIRFLTVKLTEAGKYRMEQVRIAAKKNTSEAVAHAAIRNLGKKHGIKVPKYTDDDMFILVRLGLVPSGNITPLKGRGRNTDIILPIVGDSEWYNELKRALGVATFKKVFQLAMRDYDKEHPGN